MSYNVSNVSCPLFIAYMEASDIVELYETYKDQLCESNFLHFHYTAAKELLNIPSANIIATRIQLENFWWKGDGSAISMDLLTNTICPKIIGIIEAIFTWEGGDRVSGLVVENGKATRCRVEQRVIRPR